MVDSSRIIPPLRGEAVFEKNGHFTLRYYEYLERSASAINDNSDNIEVDESLTAFSASAASQNKKIKNLELLDAPSMLTAALANMQKQIDCIELQMGAASPLTGKKLTVVAITANYTSRGGEIIICANTSAVTITLLSSPNNLDEVIVKRQNTGAVTISGTVDGMSSFPLVSRYDAPSMIFTTAAGEYSIV